MKFRRLSELSPLHDLNMPLMKRTFVVVNLDTSIDVSFEQ